MLVDGRIVTNPASLVRRGASLVVRQQRPLRGEAKLAPALHAFAVDAMGTVALDVGAAAGGFTRALLDDGAKRVYAVDAGYGQLAGSLRQDARVVVLERTNLGRLTKELVPEPVELVTIDLSYLSIAAAVPQLERLELAPGAQLVGLVKPQFELGLPAPPDDPALLAEAPRRAAAGIAAAGWTVVGSIVSPIRGAGGSTEFFVHAVKHKHRVQ